jgi:NitT/TauT family transport system permease protein
MTPMDVARRGRLGWRGYVESPLYPLTFAVALLLIWQFVIARYGFPGVPVRYLGSPVGAWDAFVGILRQGYAGHPLWLQVLASVLRVLAGFLIGAAVALPLGLVMGYYRPVGNLIAPVLSFLRPIPALAFIPVATIWFGTGELAKVVVIAVTGFLYIVLGSWLGVRSVPQDYLRAARNYNLPPRLLLRAVILPPALPQIMTSLRTGMALCWAVVVAAELIAAQVGLGFMIEDASTFFKIDVVYVGIAIIGVIGILMEFGFRAVERRLLHWIGR